MDKIPYNFTEAGHQLPEFDSQRKEASAQFHELMYRSSHGPQGEGLRYEAAKLALEDDRSILVQTQTDRGLVDLVLFCPTELTGDHNEEMIRGRYGDTPTFYFPYVEGVDYSQADIVEAADKLPEDSVVFFDHLSQDTHIETALHQLIGPVEEEEFINSVNGKPAGGFHFLGYVRPPTEEFVDNLSSAIDELRQKFQEEVERGVYEKMPVNGTTIVDPADFGHEVNGMRLDEKLWTIYEERMNEWLIKDHPSLLAYDKEYFMSSIKSPDVATFVNFTDGQPACFMMMADIRSCFWLNQSYYKSDKQRVLFCPGIVADKKSGQLASSMKSIKMYIELEKQVENPPLFATQCTEISVDYIPKLIEHALKRSGTEDGKIYPTAEYVYGAYRLKHEASPYMS